MRLVNEPAPPSPLVAALEVAGAVLVWTVTDPADDVQVAFTDPDRADWLWRLVGTEGHLAIASGADVGGVDVVPGSLAPLHRLAVGHWLRRWWPASRRDGIPGLDAALLDVEVALLTVAAQAFSPTTPWTPTWPGCSPRTR